MSLRNTGVLDAMRHVLLVGRRGTMTMRGLNTDGTEYVTPDVPWVMYYYADYALHGA